ncbi:MAG: hypothetical protein OEQ13_14900 [Acidobacteriota bacterium]|nr:hypothetical protein [Acidobacteriota bacterium]
MALPDPVRRSGRKRLRGVDPDAPSSRSTADPSAHEIPRGCPDEHGDEDEDELREGGNRPEQHVDGGGFDVLENDDRDQYEEGELSGSARMPRDEASDARDH